MCSFFCTQTSKVQIKTAIQLDQQDSPASLKAKKDCALQKIGDFIQSSPTLFGSKGQLELFNLDSVNGIDFRSLRKVFHTVSQHDMFYLPPQPRRS